MASSALPIFVYGTLQTDGCRAVHWPYPPVAIVRASVLGALFDLGPYPGLVAGDDRVAGELWYIASRHLPRTLEALDVVEGFAASDNDLYRREQIQVSQFNGASVAAFTYLYAREGELTANRRILPDADGFCRWKNC